MSKIITIEWNQVSVEDRNNNNVQHCCHVFTREEFETIIGVSLENYETVSYEPSRGIFITVDKNNVIKSFTKAEDELLLKIIDSKINEIIFETEKVLMSNKDYMLTPEYKIQEAKNYLSETSWIWEKFNRNVVVLKDMTEEEFSLKYADIIAEQERNRLLINELEIQLGGN